MAQLTTKGTEARAASGRGTPFIDKETGTPITPEMIAALAAEAAEGYDLEQATPVRVGRPPLGAAAPAPRVSVRVQAEVLGALQRRAAAEGRSVSDLAREALLRCVKEWDNQA